MPRTTAQPRRLAAGTLAAVLGLLVPAGCATEEIPTPAVGGSPASTAVTAPTGGDPPMTAAPQEKLVKIRLSVGDQDATGTLEDNPATRDLVSMLPITVPMGDLFDREKPGRLPQALIGDVQPVFTYRVGQIAYWPPGQDIFVVYDGDGLRVPGPGLIPLGTVETGLEVIAAAGDDFDMTITVLD